jgi:hypothetical protein
MLRSGVNTWNGAIMDISLIVNILILAALLYVAYKLHAVASALARLLERNSRERDMRDSSPAAQTINVNVAPVPGSAQTVSTSSGLAPASSSAQGSAAISSSDASGVTGPAGIASSPADSGAGAAPEKKSAPSGPFSVKCSRCHAENSSYRSECFNCGNPL